VESVHLNFVIQERIPLWVAERLIGALINDPRFRTVLPPAALTAEAMPGTIRDVCELLLECLSQVDVDHLAGPLRTAAEREASAA
jgi:hypothetical protein